MSLDMLLFTVIFVFGQFYTISGSNSSLSVARTFGPEQQSSSNYQPQAAASHHGWSGWGAHGGGGGGGFQSFFDIALTGLAFLSFGIFLLNLLLNALLGAGFITGTVFPTGTGTASGTGGIITVTGTGSAKASRSRRSAAATFELDPVSSSEVMASVILQSIDAMVNEHECVKKVFCDGNKDARSIGHGFQYLFPAYSIGASYITQKIGLHRCLPDHVKAIFHGIQNSNCQKEFPKC